MNINKNIINKSLKEKKEEDDDDISILIKNSAVNKKNPGLFSDNKNIKTMVDKTNIQRIKEKYVTSLKDFFVGKKEEYLIKYKKTSSERAIIETMSYYKSLYISKNPDLDSLVRLIKRNKIIDFPNQYVFGQPEYFEFHESGTLSIELNTILSHVVNKQDAYFDVLQIEKIKSNRNKDWMTLEESYESNLLEEEENDKIKYELAVQSWIIIVSSSYNVDYLKNNIHPDNIELATIDCLMNFIENKYVTKEKYIKGIKKLKIVDEKIIDALLNKKEKRKENFNNRMNNSNVEKRKIDTDPDIIKKIPSLKDLKEKTKG